MPQPETLEWLITTLKWYEELREKNATYVHAVSATSAEAASRVENWRDLLQVSGQIAAAAGIGRIHLLCDELPNADGLTAANVTKLRATVCRAKPCALETANTLTLDEAASIIERAEHLTPAKTTPAKATDGPELGLWSIWTNGVTDDRIRKVPPLVSDDALTVNEKLTKIDALIPFPATASAEQLAKLFGVTNQAVLKTDWWSQNRKGEKDSEIGRRRAGHQRRAKEYEKPGTADEDN
jgi:hypothetical protein